MNWWSYLGTFCWFLTHKNCTIFDDLKFCKSWKICNLLKIIDDYLWKQLNFFFVQGYPSFQKWNRAIDRYQRKNDRLTWEKLDKYIFQFFTYISIFRNKQWWKSRKNWQFIWAPLWRLAYIASWLANCGNYYGREQLLYLLVKMMCAAPRVQAGQVCVMT